ncbi:HpcH/HpaI aldolase family protein [Paenibacillus chungangensis]|uniref:HpcH/HpaI aldolase/citrate lyase family protein n=1 Tax=Paenibacillus chungangensis TaxID=696535 RepID=A0ABW3HSY4_9BACL
MSGTVIKLRNRELLFGTMISYMTWTGLVPLLRKRRLDFAVFEMEHNHYDWSELEALLRTANLTELTAFVRVPDIGYAHLSKALDLGADGVLIPRIESLEQLREVIDIVRLPPRGRKGVGGYDFAVDDLTDKLSLYNDEKLILIQVESMAAVQTLDTMLATGEVAGVIVGPYDLSVSMGIPGDFRHPRFMEAVHEVIRLCDSHQLSCGMFMGSEQDIRYWHEQGMNIVWSGSDLGMLLDGYHRLCDVVESL